MNTVYFGNFGNDPKKTSAYLRENPDTKLVIEPGTYELTGDIARKTMNDVLNGVYGDNPERAMFSPSFKYDTGFSLEDMKNITVDAYGATFLINGFMEPVTIKNSSDITINGLTIDHKRKPYSKGTVTSCHFEEGTNNGSFTVVFGDTYPVNAKTPMPRITFFDPERDRITLYNQFSVLSHEYISAQTFLFRFEGLSLDPTGMELYVWHTFHSRPAILIENSANVTLRGVTLHSQPGMGVVSHRSENLLFSGIRVVPSCSEHMSTNTDALHITSAKGTVRVENSFFEGQGDDTLNIHTYYHRIKKTGANTCEIYLDSPTKTHSQTPDYPDNGDILELTEYKTLVCADTYRVLSRIVHPESWSSELTLDKPLPDNVDSYVFANATRQPKLEFVGNYLRNHLARGVLIKVKNALIEDNYITDVVGTAIYVAAESWWREGVCATENIVIRRNRILYCGRTDDIRQRDCAGICVTVDADEPTKKTHDNVIIQDNIVDCPHSPHGIYVSNTKKLTLERNFVTAAAEPVVINN